MMSYKIEPSPPTSCSCILLMSNIAPRNLYTAAISKLVPYANLPVFEKDNSLQGRITKLVAVYERAQDASSANEGKYHIIIHVSTLNAAKTIIADLSGVKFNRFFDWEGDDKDDDIIQDKEQEKKPPPPVPPHAFLPPPPPTTKPSYSTISIHRVELTTISPPSSSSPPPSTDPQPPSQNCVICQESYSDGPDEVATMTTLCDHTFHLSCLRRTNAMDPRCPICRYSMLDGMSQSQSSFETATLDDDNSNICCGVCEVKPKFKRGGTIVSVCLICGDVGCKDVCGRQHYESTSHNFAKEWGGRDSMNDHHIWDYAGGEYVHRLVEGMVDEENPSPRKIVAVSAGKGDDCENHYEEMSTKLEGLAAEYVSLLNLELEKQREWFSSVLGDMQSGFEEKKAELLLNGETNKHKPNVATVLRNQIKALQAKETCAREKQQNAEKECGGLRTILSGLEASKKNREREIVQIGVDTYKEGVAAAAEIAELEKQNDALMKQLDD